MQAAMKTSELSWKGWKGERSLALPGLGRRVSKEENKKIISIKKSNKNDG